ncbi:DUF2711 family protein [Bacillus nakamurai]|uniref:DUF2711 family protein n=1 Tax=Bacillus nakamurai TaxID=1793963 RepID=UPI001E4B8950|nr:DUF2711 family protein [Bacillus nakamurai]MCC9021198.1 DUF2711 domain-containing protein [Bacillus nakamurai]
MCLLETLSIEPGVPILHQLPKPFSSAAFLLHPFVRMPSGWEQKKRKRPFEHIYPSDAEMLASGVPVSWETVMNICGLRSEKETALALMSVTKALQDEYARPESAALLDRLNDCQDLYFPIEDYTSAFLIPSLLDVFSSKGSERCTYFEPIEQHGMFSLHKVTPLEVCNLLQPEMVIADEQRNAAFMSVYDSFTTLFLMKDQDMAGIVRAMNWEAVICRETTCIDWFYQ